MKHTTRTDDGRYVVRLPFKQNKECLGESFTIAQKRFISMERRLARDAEIQMQYKAFLDEFDTLGHMSEVKHVDLKQPAYYIPHQESSKKIV